MKYLITILCVVFALSANGQTVTTMPLILGDTVVNTATVSKTLPVISGGYSGAAVQYVLTKISGTIAGKTYLYNSLDNVNYGAPIDSNVNTDQTTNTFVFRRTAPTSNYLKVVTTGAGTMSGQIRIKYSYKYYQPQ